MLINTVLLSIILLRTYPVAVCSTLLVSRNRKNRSMYTCWRKRLWPGTLNARTRNGLDREYNFTPEKDSFQAQFHDWDWDDLSFCFTSLWASLGFDFSQYMCVPKSYQMIRDQLHFWHTWCSRWVQKNEWSRSLEWTERKPFFGKNGLKRSWNH